MIAVQPAFYAELFGAGVRYTGFAASREIGAAIAGFSPVIATALLARSGGDPWLVALLMIGASLISLIAFAASRETREIDIAAFDTDQTSVVSASWRGRGAAAGKTDG